MKDKIDKVVEKSKNLQIKIIIAITMISILFLTFCSKNKNPIEPTQKYFEPTKLELLNLEELDSFWLADSTIEIHESNSALFRKFDGFKKSIMYSGDLKGIKVSVFATQNIAVQAMDSLINNVVCIIIKDTSETFKDLAWYSACIPNLVFTNKWNTIIETSYYHPDFDAIKGDLYNCAFEVSRRIDSLSAIQ